MFLRPMLVLGLDSAGAGASAALWRDGAVIASRAVAQERGQAEFLMPMIAALLEEAEIQPQALDAIGVVIGPGSFTGLRIAIAAARGLALALDVPAIGISRFAAVAAQFPAARRAGRALLVALDTKRDDFFLQLFAGGEAAPFLAGADAAAEALPRQPLLLVGDGAGRLAAALAQFDVVVPDDADRPCAAQAARLAAEAVAAGTPLPPPRPLYLRAPDTTKPRTTPQS